MLKNMTPHPVTLRLPQGDVLLESAGVIRLTEETEDLDPIVVDGVEVPVRRVRMVPDPNTVPPRREGTTYVVSRVVAAAFPERDDFVAPGETVRDDAGRVVAVKDLVRVV